MNIMELFIATIESETSLLKVNSPLSIFLLIYMGSHIFNESQQ